MQVLEILKEKEKEEALNISDPDEEGVVIGNGEKETPTEAPPKAGDKNWAVKALSKEAWLLLFFQANYKKRVKDKNPPKTRLENWYDRFIVKMPPDYPLPYFRRNLTMLVNLDVEGVTPEAIISRLIKGVENTLGFTIGPSWNVQGLQGKTVKHIQLINDFMKMLEYAGPELTTAQQAAQISALDDTKANSIAYKLYEFIRNKSYLGLVTDPKTAEILQELRKIRTKADWDLVAKLYKKRAENSVPPGKGDIIEDFKKMAEDEKASPIMRKIASHFQRIGVEFDDKGLFPKSPYGWTGELAPADVIDGPDKLEELSKSLDKRFKEEYKDIYKWTEDTTTSGADVFKQARKTFTSELKKIIKNKPTVREVIKVWEIHFLNRLIRLHTKYKN